jgi:hypothetical protein
MKTPFPLLVPLLLSSTFFACVTTQAPISTTTDTTPPPPAGPMGAPSGATAAPTPAAPTPAATTTPPTAGMPAPATPATPPGPGAPAGAADKFAGAWTSPSCGARTYPRKIQFDRGGSFEAQDLVSPCPPKTACIWSGIVINRGTYAVEPRTIRLSVPQPRTGPNAQPFPTTLAIDGASSAPVETSAEGAKCAYAHDDAAPEHK